MWQDLNDYLDLNSDTSLWDLDGGSQKMSDLVIGKKLHAPEQLTMTDTINPYAPLFNSQAHNASLQLNSTIASETPGSANPRFKTEICRNFKEKGTCLYGDLCQFAHGKHELRGDVVRHAKYKTKPCQKYWVAGYCAYGPRCNFVHQEVDRKTALQLLSEGCGKQLAPNIAQSVHDFRPRVAKVNDRTLVDFNFVGNEPAIPNGLYTKLDQLSYNGIGKDSGYGDSRQA